MSYNFYFKFYILLLYHAGVIEYKILTLYFNHDAITYE